MVADDVPGEAVQDELARFVGSLSIETERTGQTYDTLVRAMLTPA
jgi:adenylate cyclase, class 2